MIVTSPVPPFISAAEVKVHMRKTGDDGDATLPGFVGAACRMVIDRMGQVAPVQAVHTERVRRLRRTIVLEDRPVVSITSVTGRNGAIPPASPGVHGWVLKGASGVLEHTHYWPPGLVVVELVAGRDPLPDNFRLASLELCAHLWKQSQLATGGGRPAFAGDDQVVVPGASYALPYRVRELLGLGKQPTDEPLVG